MHRYFYYHNFYPIYILSRQSLSHTGLLFAFVSSTIRCAHHIAFSSLDIAIIKPITSLSIVIFSEMDLIYYFMDLDLNVA